jgi:hypothetical protein
MWGLIKNYTQKTLLKSVDNLRKTVDKRPILWRSAYIMENGEEYANYYDPHRWGSVFLTLSLSFPQSAEKNAFLSTLSIIYPQI